MRKLLLVLPALALYAAPLAQSPPAQQADGVVRLLADLETSLAAPQEDAFRRIAAPGLPQADLEVVQEIRSGDGPARAVLQERDRVPEGDGYSVLVDLLVSHGLDGRIATWQISARPSPRARDRFEIAGLKQLAMVDGLVKLLLDRTREFAVHNLVFSSTDFTLKMTAGTAFLAQGENGRTALVLRGRGEVHFAPPDAAEQGQLMIFARHPALDTPIDAAFIRVHPAAFESNLSEHSLVPVEAIAADAARAQEVFDQFAGRTFGLGLSDLSSDRWSLLPGFGNMAVEFKSARFGWLTYTRSPSEAEDISLFDRPHNHNLSLYTSATKARARGRAYSEDDDDAYDVLQYDLDLTFDPTRPWVSGRGGLRIRIVADGATSLTFKLAEALRVSSITSPELGRLLGMRVVGQTAIIVSLPQPLAAGREVTLVFAYSGRLDSQELSREAIRIEAQSGQEGLADTPELKPEPRYMYSNHVYWYPQATSTDFALASMRLTVPSTFQIVASGRAIGSSVGPVAGSSSSRGDARYARTAEFFADRPIRYLSCVITRLVPLGRITAEVPAVAPASPATPAALEEPAAPALYLEIASTPRVTGRNRQLPALSSDIVKFYARLVGEVPYPNLTVVAADALLPGGHSPAFFALLQQPLPTSPLSWRDDPLAFDRYPNYLIAHEIAHQWWGQAVGFKNYHEQWLSEGLAQYSSVMYLSSVRPDVLRPLVREMRISAESMMDRGPIWLGYRLGHIEGRGAVFRAIVYNKSAVVLHMLRRLIGDDAFKRGLRRFYRDWRFKKAGTDDLRAAFEAEASRPLGRFFDRWIFGSSVPRLRVTSRLENGGQSALVRVEQIGETFDLPLTIGIDYTDGRTEEVSLAITEPMVEQRIPLNGTVRRIGPKDDLIFAKFVN